MDKDDANEERTLRTSESDGESTDRKLPARLQAASDQRAPQHQSEEKDRKRKAEPSAASKKFKKPKDMPKRPLSAYNIYFQLERTKILKKHEQGEVQEDFNVVAVDNTAGDGEKKKQKRQGGVFQALARTIADRWKALAADERAKYENLASIEMQKYRKKMDQYKQDMVEQALEDRRVRKLHGEIDSTELPSSSSAAGAASAASRQNGKASAAAAAVSSSAGTRSTGARTVSAISSSSTSGTDSSFQQRSAAQELSNFLLQQPASMQPNSNNSFSSNVVATSTTDSSAQQNAAQPLAAFLSQQPQTIPQFPFAIAGSVSQYQPARTATTDLQSLLQQLSGSHGTAPMQGNSSTPTSSTEQQAIQELMNVLSQQPQQSAPALPHQLPNQRPTVQPHANYQLQSSAAQNPAAVDWSQMTSTLAPVANLLKRQTQMAAKVRQQQQQPDLLSGFLQQLLGNQPSGEQQQSAPPTGGTSNSFFAPEMFAALGSNPTTQTAAAPLDQNMRNMLAQALHQPQQPLNFPGPSLSGFVNPSSIPLQQQQQQQQQVTQSSSPDPFTDANLMALLVQQLMQQQQQGGNNQQQQHHQQP